MITDTEALDRGRLFTLRMRRNAAARRDALETVRQRPDGQWQARIGGRMRGKVVLCPTQARAEAAVNDHYNEALFNAETGGRW